MNFSKLELNPHQEAKANGWWEEERNLNHQYALVLSEVSEAFEAFRKGAYCSRHPLPHCYYVASSFEADETYKDDFKRGIKDTFQDEIADTAIRLCDIAGSLNIDLDLEIEPMEVSPKGQFTDEFIDWVTMTSKWMNSNIKPKRAIHVGLSRCVGIAKEYNFHLEAHMIAKMLFNRTRGKKHGGKIC